MKQKNVFHLKISLIVMTIFNGCVERSNVYPSRGNTHSISNQVSTTKLLVKTDNNSDNVIGFIFYQEMI